MIPESTNSAVPASDLLGRQLSIAMDADAVFCIGCGQPDEPELHDAARCPGSGGVLDLLPVVSAIEIFDASCEALPDLDEHARALHCAILAAAVYFIPPASTSTAIAAGETDAEVQRILAMTDDEILAEADVSDVAWARGFKAGLKTGQSVAAAPKAASEDEQENVNGMVDARERDSSGLFGAASVADGHGQFGSVAPKAASACDQCNGHGYLVTAPATCSPGGERIPCGKCQTNTLEWKDGQWSGKANIPIDVAPKAASEDGASER